MNTFMVALPPFIHRKREELNIWLDYFLSIIPGTVYIIITDGQWNKFFTVFGVSLVSMYVVSYFNSTNIWVKILQACLTAGLVFILTGPVNGRQLAILGALVCISIVVYEIIFLNTSVTPFKPVIIVSVFLLNTVGFASPDFSLFLKYLYLVGIMYLVFKKRINLYFLLGSGIGFLAAGLIYHSIPEFYGNLPVLLIYTLVLSYPGILPLYGKKKGITGFIGGAAVSVLGFLGIPLVAITGSIFKIND